MSTVKRSYHLTLLTRAVEIWAATESELIWSTRLEADGKQFKQCDRLIIAYTQNNRLL